jgi:hypothetical protein
MEKLQNEIKIKISFKFQKLSESYKKIKILKFNFKSSYPYQLIVLFQLKQSLANIHFKIKITNLLVTSLNQPILLINQL